MSELLLSLLELFEDASFSKDASAVLASLVFPDCNAVLRVLSNESILEVLEVELLEEVSLSLDALSGGGGGGGPWLCICCAILAIAASDSSLLIAPSLSVSNWLKMSSEDVLLCELPV